MILIRDTKVGKGRNVSVSASTIEALATYAHRGDRPRTATGRLFVSLAGTPVFYSNFAKTFGDALATAGVGTGSPVRPRIHDLRHSFAVRTLLGWYRAGLDAEGCCRVSRPISGTVRSGSPTGISPPLPICSARRRPASRLSRR